MSDITLIKEHQLIMNKNLPLFDSDGNILVQDVQSELLITHE